MTMGPDLLAHLDAQLRSARVLLDLVVKQGRAVRKRDVDVVLHALGEIQVEMERRGKLERDRAQLLTRAGQSLGIPAHAVTLDAIAGVLSESDAGIARQRSAELRGLLAEIAREHQVNRTLMRQELAFLGHLTSMLGGDHPSGQTGYQPSGRHAVQAAPPLPTQSSLRALDLQA